MSIDTLGEAENLHWRIIATCSCKVREELSLRSLVWTRGRAFPLAGLAERLRCPVCGGRDIRVTFDVPTKPIRSPFEAPRFKVEILDVRGNTAEVIAEVRKLDDAIAIFDRVVAKRPNAHVILGDKMHLIREHGRRKRDT